MIRLENFLTLSGYIYFKLQYSIMFPTVYTHPFVVPTVQQSLSQQVASVFPEGGHLTVSYTSLCLTPHFVS